MHKPIQPADIAPCYIFLASEESCYMTGQVLHLMAEKLLMDK